jgi:hypothetical protein
MYNVLDTTRVKSCLVDCIGNHISERCRVIIGGSRGKNLGFGTEFAGIVIWRRGPLDGVPGVI